MSKLPLISIIVAVYNGSKTLQACLDSIANQTCQNLELIVMDGGSTDGTVDILQRNSPAIGYWESQKDCGIAHAWNKALEHTKGEWILFLGADDRLQDEHVLSDMANVLRNDSFNDVVYGQIVFEGGATHGLVLGDASELGKLKRRMIIPHQAAFHRNTFFREVGKFDEAFRIAMDYDVLLRKKTLSVQFVERCITVMGGEGVSSRLIKKSLIEWRVAQIKNTVDWRFKIEVWHAYYRLRYLLNSWRTKWGTQSSGRAGLS
jgi:glycosyltransferase involved in cell wall biosynthesis